MRDHQSLIEQNYIRAPKTRSLWFFLASSQRRVSIDERDFARGEPQGCKRALMTNLHTVSLMCKTLSCCNALYYHEFRSVKRICGFYEL